MKLDDLKNLRSKEDIVAFVKQMPPKEKFIAGFCVVVLFLGLVRWVFNLNQPDYDSYTASAVEEQVAAAETPEEEEAVAEEATAPDEASAENAAQQT